MRTESFVTKPTLTGSQINLLQMKIDKHALQYDESKNDFDNELKSFNELKQIELDFLFDNLNTLINKIKNETKT